MLKALDIVKGGVAKKDLSPILKHLRVKDGWITATNGRLTISAPLDEDIGEFVVPADKFITAVKASKRPKFKITPSGRLSVSGGRFKALLPLMPDEGFPLPPHQNTPVNSPDFISVVTKLSVFIGDDASRPWACGILIHNKRAYATNNTIIASCGIEWEGDSINIPGYLINELLRLKLPATYILANRTAITIGLKSEIGTVWVNSSLLDTDWPNAKALIESAPIDHVVQIPPELKTAIEEILPFCPDKKFPRIYITENAVTTDEGNHEAAVSIQGLPPSVWRAEPMLKLLTIPSGETLSADFTQWPKPCPWTRTDGLRGLIIGLRGE